MSTYRVVFWGETLPGKKKEAVMLAFADKFGIRSGNHLRTLFSGKPNVLKRGLDRTYAKRLTLAVEAVGGVCRMEEETPYNAPSYDQNESESVQIAGDPVPSTYPQGLAKKLVAAKKLPPKRVSPHVVAPRKHHSPFA